MRVMCIENGRSSLSTNHNPNPVKSPSSCCSRMDFSESRSVNSYDNANINEMTPLLNSHEQSEICSAASLGKQRIFGPTVNEIQNMSGRSFGSVDMDEFLDTVWPSEGNQRIFSDLANFDEQVFQNVENWDAVSRVQVQPDYVVPTPVTCGIVEEPWARFFKEEYQQENPCDGVSNRDTLGRMTLEDFLIKAGVIAESTASPRQHSSNTFFADNDCSDKKDGVGQVMGDCDINSSKVVARGNVSLNSGPSNGFAANGNTFVRARTNLELDLMFTPSRGKPKSTSDASQSSSRKRNCPSQEVSVQKRTRRMIKNRESAARSRARKQAYTAELEMELDKVRKENEMLKQILAEFGNQERQERKEENQSGKGAMESKAILRSFSASW